MKRQCVKAYLYGDQQDGLYLQRNIAFKAIKIGKKAFEVQSVFLALSAKVEDEGLPVELESARCRLRLRPKL